MGQPSEVEASGLIDGCGVIELGDGEYHVWNGHREGYTCHRSDAEPTISVLHHPAHGEYMVFLALCVGLAVVVWAIRVQTTTRDLEQELFQQALGDFLRDSRPIDDSV